jgi:hypothetical protein
LAINNSGEKADLPNRTQESDQLEGKMEKSCASNDFKRKNEQV